MSGLQGLSTCKLCLEPVTNPLCVSCISLSVNLWIRKENEEIFSEFSKKSSTLFDFLSESEDNIEFCVKCHDFTYKVLCPYCYTHSVYKILESINWIKAEKFKIIFDFDLEKAGFDSCNNCDEEMVHVKNFEPLTFVESKESVVDLCESCGGASYFTEEINGEMQCDNCLAKGI